MIRGETLRAEDACKPADSQQRRPTLVGRLTHDMTHALILGSVRRPY